MNASDILKYGDSTLMQAIVDLPETARQVSGVCGVWTVQDVLAHMASFETMLTEILGNLLQPQATPTLDCFLNANSTFNDDQVALRKGHSWEQILAEYKESQELTMIYIGKFPPETLRQPGVLAWYGAGYSIDDFLVYTYYGHKREHGAQIAVFRDTLA